MANGGTWWTFEAVRDALVDAAALWARSPGGGRWPFASDGPWHLMTRERSAGDYDARGGDGVSSDVPLKPLPLSCEEVARRDAVSEWLRAIEKPEDRRLVIMACDYLARGYSRVPWGKIKRRMGVAFGKDGLRRRHDRAISEVSKALNAGVLRVDWCQGVEC